MKKFKNINHKYAYKALGLLVIDLFFFGGTNTTNVASYVMIVGFILLVVSCYLVANLVINFIKLYGIPIKRKRRLAASITAVFGLLIALQSIGELSVKDILVLSPLVIVGYIYTIYAKANGQKIS